MTIPEYKDKIKYDVKAAFGYFPDVTVRHNDVNVTCDTYGGGITFAQIIALRDVFGAEFNIAHEHTDGTTTDSGTWFPGERSIIFTFKMPVES